MKPKNASSRARLFSGIVYMLTIAQTAITFMPIEDKTTVSAVAMFLVLTFTAAKQWVSVEVKSRQALIVTGAIFGLALVGAINESKVIEIFDFTEKTSQWIRFCLVLIVAALDYTSKMLFPSKEAKEVEELKKELVIDQKIKATYS